MFGPEQQTKELELPPRHNPFLTDYSKIGGKVGILGGSFDPVHNGHLDTSMIAQEQFALDSIIFIPTVGNPLKENAPIASFEHRLDLIAEALIPSDNLYVSAIETEGERSVYTYDTIQKLKDRIDSECMTYLIIGSDCLQGLHRWHKIHELIQLTEFIIVQRPGTIPIDLESLSESFSRSEIEKLAKGVILSEGPELSSTMVRERLARNESTLGLVPDIVRETIEIRHLY